MDSISFTNFRRFKDKTTFDLNNVNILVGPNNSGKSTLTKGFRLYMYNILNLNVNNDRLFGSKPFFNFACVAYDNPHIGTFGRALSKGATDDTIVFSATFANMIVETTVSRYSIHSKDNEGNIIDYFDKPSAPIVKIRIENLNLDVCYEYDFEREIYKVDFNVTGDVDYYEKWRDRLEKMKNPQNLESVYGSGYLSPEIDRIKKCLSFNCRKHFSLVSKKTSRLENGNYYERLIQSFLKEHNNFEINKEVLLFTDDECFAYYFLQINYDIQDHFRTFVLTERPVVVEAHSVTHSLVYNISDKNDYMAQTISDYISLDIKNNDPERLFIEDWMMKFEVGEDFVVESFGGECFKFEIIEDVDWPERRIPLLDKGVGSNQIMILLLRIATIMRKNRGATIPNTVIVEEPEQNLHPKLQSMLADLFEEVHSYPKGVNENSCGIKFIVETHSEYLVRKSQVIVSKCLEKKDVPFNVYYLEDGQFPRKMIYQSNGLFANDFGEGFYDESIRLTEEIV